MSPQAWATKEKHRLMGLQQTKRFSNNKGNHQQVKRHPTEWENRLKNNISDKESVFKIYKKLLQLNTKNTNSPI